MQKVNWLLVGIISFVIILILFGAGMLMGDWRYRDWGMMGPSGMRENWGYSSTPSPLGWAGMIFMGLIPCRSHCADSIRCRLACAEPGQLQVAIFLTWIMNNDPV